MTGLFHAGGALGVTIALLLIVPPVFATHEVDHRFIVFGTVRDAQGSPIPDAKVIVVDPRLNEGMTAFTDRRGDYEALLHLHSTDVGDEIIVTALDQRKSIRAEFDPNDVRTDRKVRVDFGPAEAAPPPQSRTRTGLVMGLILAVGAVAGFVLFRRYQRKGSVSPKGRKKGR